MPAKQGAAAAQRQKVDLMLLDRMDQGKKVNPTILTSALGALPGAPSYLQSLRANRKEQEDHNASISPGSARSPLREGGLPTPGDLKSHAGGVSITPLKGDEADRSPSMDMGSPRYLREGCETPFKELNSPTSLAALSPVKFELSEEVGSHSEGEESDASAGAGSDGEGEEDGSLPASPRRKSKHVQVFKPDRGNARAKGGLLWRVQPQHGDIVVKQGSGPSFPAALESARPGARIFVEGVHSWPGSLVFDKKVQVVGAGASSACLHGRFVLREYPIDEVLCGIETRASFDAPRPILAGFSGVNLQHISGEGRKMNLAGNYMGETVVVKGGAWRFLGCKLTCEGAPPLFIGGKADVRLLECRIGGVSQEERASSGVCVTGSANCELHTSVIQWTDDTGYTQIADELTIPESGLLANGETPGKTPATARVHPAAGNYLGSMAGGPMPSVSMLSSVTGQQGAIGIQVSSGACVVRHTARLVLECCQLLDNQFAVVMSECAHVESSHCMYHDHNEGGILIILSPGNGHRDSTLLLSDNKRSRTQVKSIIALGRPGKYIRNDGTGSYDALPKDTKQALARLDTLFDVPKPLFTALQLVFRN
ncbi:hypothetical protein T484DRAFT_2543727 [Baffinella frigidus]|nr:hypothetical protein T484DRAFT_2543727 [Cryptophyta sp. CCMP2293]